jgi:predicted ATPase
MITRFHVENYKALRDVTLELTPIHVLIGPNDSGKTSIFEALSALSRTTQYDLNTAFSNRWQGRELVWKRQPEAIVSLGIALRDAEALAEYRLGCRFVSETGRGGATWAAETLGEATKLSAANPSSSTLIHHLQRPDSPLYKAAKTIRDGLVPLQSYRWVPSHLSLPIAFGGLQRYQMDATGFGLALVLDDIVREDHTRFAELERQFREIFPYIKTIKLPREHGYHTLGDQVPQAPGVSLYFELMNGGGTLSAAQASDGLLLVLAYLALLHLPEPPRILLIEEPENGIHPQRLREVLNMLKELVSEQSKTQVLLTTHSPYVVDCFTPREVTLCVKDKDGAVTTHRLSDSKAVREQMDIFQLGEIWTAEGDEALATAGAG